MNETIGQPDSPARAKSPSPDTAHTSSNHAPKEPLSRDGKLDGGEPINRTARTRIAVFVVVLLAVVAGGTAYYLKYLAPFESTDDAAIEGHVTTIAPQISGRVAKVLVRDNQEVKEGDVLIEIDPSDYETRLASARANLAAARSQLAQAKAQLAVDEAKVKQEQASLAAVEARAGYAQADWKRYQSIGNLGVSQSQIELAQTQAQSANAELEAARGKVAAAEAQVALSRSNIETANAVIRQNESAVSLAELNLSYAKVVAPDAGRVTRRTVEKGAYVQTGQALLSLVPRQVWVVANFKETQLENMRPGQPVEIKVDAYPHHKFNGHVDSIQTGAGARFSLFPPENATGNYIKVLQRVPVKIVFDDASLGDPEAVLGPGMSVEPRVRVK